MFCTCNLFICCELPGGPLVRKSDIKMEENKNHLKYKLGTEFKAEDMPLVTGFVDELGFESMPNILLIDSNWPLSD